MLHMMDIHVAVNMIGCSGGIQVSCTLRLAPVQNKFNLMLNKPN